MTDWESMRTASRSLCRSGRNPTGRGNYKGAGTRQTEIEEIKATAT